MAWPADQWESCSLGHIGLSWSLVVPATLDRILVGVVAAHYKHSVARGVCAQRPAYRSYALASTAAGGRSRQVVAPRRR
jgi:hypothetical protein